ncbi:hypothetical protein NPIL_699441, partial [Nephila pilipes]
APTKTKQELNNLTDLPSSSASGSPPHGAPKLNLIQPSKARPACPTCKTTDLRLRSLQNNLQLDHRLLQPVPPAKQLNSPPPAQPAKQPT